MCRALLALVVLWGLSGTVPHLGADEDAAAAGRAASARGAWGEAARYFASALENDPANRAAAIDLAQASSNARHAAFQDLAEEALRRLHAEDAKDAEVELALAELYRARAPCAANDQLASALRHRARAHFTALIRTHSDLGAAAVGLARVHYDDGDTAKAVAALDAFLGTRPTDPSAVLLWKGKLLYQEARKAHTANGGGYPLTQPTRRLFTRAQGASLSAAAADAKSFDAWMHVAWSSQVLGDRETALQGYEKAYALDAKSPLPLRGLAVLYAHDEEAYARVIARLKQQDPEQRRLRLLEGYEFVKQKEWCEVVPFFEAFVAEFGDDADALFYLGLGHAGQGAEAKAVGLFEHVLTLDGDHVLAAEELDRRYRGKALAAAKRSMEEAQQVIATYRRWMELAPRNPYLRNNLGYMLREAWKAHQKEAAWRPVLLWSARTYEEAAQVIGRWDAKYENTMTWGRRYAFAQMVNDAGVMFHLFAPIKDFARAEKYYVRALEYVGWGYLDAWTYLRRIYEEQARWDELHELATKCAKGLANEAGEPLEAARQGAEKVAADLKEQGLVE